MLYLFLGQVRVRLYIMIESSIDTFASRFEIRQRTQFHRSSGEREWPLRRKRWRWTGSELPLERIGRLEMILYLVIFETI